MKRLLSSMFFAIILVDALSQTIDKSAESLTPGEGEKKVIVIGIGNNRDQALKNAFENSVSEAIGSLVSSETLVNNDSLIKDEIRLYNKGFIKTYKILSESQKSQNYEIIIAAIVAKKQIFETLKAKGITVSYNTSGMFAKIEEWESKKWDELAIAENLFNRTDGIHFDYEIKVENPMKTGTNYIVPVEVNAIPNQNYLKYILEFKSFLSELAFDKRTDLHIKERNAYINFEYTIVTRTCELEGKRKINNLKGLNNVEIFRMNDANIHVGTEKGSINEAVEYINMGGSNAGRIPYNIFATDYSPFIVVFSEGKNEGGAKRITTVFSILNENTIDLIASYIAQINEIKYQIIVKFIDGSERKFEFNSGNVNQSQECDTYELINGVTFGAKGSIFEGNTYDIVIQLPYKGLSIFLDPKLKSTGIPLKLKFNEQEIKSIKEITIEPL